MKKVLLVMENYVSQTGWQSKYKNINVILTCYCCSKILGTSHIFKGFSSCLHRWLYPAFYAFTFRL